jgi:hypothetical protein
MADLGLEPKPNLQSKIQNSRSRITLKFFVRSFSIISSAFWILDGGFGTWSKSKIRNLKSKIPEVVLH